MRMLLRLSLARLLGANPTMPDILHRINLAHRTQPLASMATRWPFENCALALIYRKFALSALRLE